MYSFDSMLERSKDLQAETDIETLRSMVHGCKGVRRTSTSLDRKGVDYVATLRGGAELHIDAKNRTKGCSRYWTDGPEVALEVWSVRPGGRFNVPDSQAKTGWTLCESKDVDLILFTFDPSDCETAYLFAYQHLRMAFRENCHTWRRKYKIDVQQSHYDGQQWESECVFVPVGVVEAAIKDVRRTALRSPQLNSAESSIN